MFIGKHDENGNPIQFPKIHGMFCKCGGQMYLNILPQCCVCFKTVNLNSKKKTRKKRKEEKRWKRKS